MKTADIHRFFEDLSSRVEVPVQILLTGGAAGILQGMERATFDIDFELKLKKPSRAGSQTWESLQRALNETAQATGITPQYAEDIDMRSSIALPSTKSRIHRRFGKIEVRVLDPGLWAIGKLARYLSTDISDLRVVLKAPRTQPVSTVKLWGTALGGSPASSSQGTFRRQVENFLDLFAREIWGATADPAKLKKLFQAAARKAAQKKLIKR